MSLEPWGIYAVSGLKATKKEKEKKKKKNKTKKKEKRKRSRAVSRRVVLWARLHHVQSQRKIR